MSAGRCLSGATWRKKGKKRHYSGKNTRQDEQVVNKEIKREFFSRCSLSREKTDLYLSAQACAKKITG